MALSFHGVGGSIGDVAGPVATGLLLLVLGWQGILSLYAIAPFFLAFMAVWAFHGIGGPSSDTGSASDFKLRKEATKKFLRNRVMCGAIAVRGLRAMCLVALVTILPLYLDNDLGDESLSPGYPYRTADRDRAYCQADGGVLVGPSRPEAGAGAGADLFMCGIAAADCL